jgi:hypothetical protein
MGDIPMLAISILLIGAMIGGFAKYNSEKDKMNLWTTVFAVIVGVYLLGRLLNLP